MRAPKEFKDSCGNPLGKAPALRDGNLSIHESGAITEYLCESYDKDNTLIPKDRVQRVKVLQWIHASEATFMLHSLAITYARWTIPENGKTNGNLEAMEKAMSNNVQNDLNWLETELSLSQGRFLCGEYVTAADIMMEFSVDFILKNNLGTQGKTWPNIEKWLNACQESSKYKKAVQKTGHKIG